MGFRYYLARQSGNRNGRQRGRGIAFLPSLKLFSLYFGNVLKIVYTRARSLPEIIPKLFFHTFRVFTYIITFLFLLSISYLRCYSLHESNYFRYFCIFFLQIVLHSGFFAYICKVEREQRTKRNRSPTRNDIIAHAVYSIQASALRYKCSPMF